MLGGFLNKITLAAIVCAAFFNPSPTLAQEECIPSDSISVCLSERQVAPGEKVFVSVFDVDPDPSVRNFSIAQVATSLDEQGINVHPIPAFL
jgi:hypothetical protein